MTEIQTFLRNSCSNLTGLASLEEARETADHRLGMDGESLLERLMAIVERFLSGGPLDDKKKVTAFLTLVENGVKMIGPFLKGSQTRISNSQTEVKVWMEKGMSPPQGNLVASAHHAQLNTTWKTATGDIYPGFTTAALICYHGLENSIPTRYFHEPQEKTDKKFHMNSKVLTVAVSNQDTSVLQEDIILTFKHLQQKPEKYKHICVYWDPDKDGGAWSDRGCETVSSTVNHTVCSCSHLSSFAVLMASFDGKDPFELQVFTWVGLVLSLICLILSIITFSTIRSIKSTRTTIHLHLCICLFIADLIFLAGISPTGNKVGCSVVAGLLHFFFLAAFCWMCLEGVQLFRMVVLVFHTTMRPLYMMLAGYGVPAIIVIISAISNSKGYGTDHHCWLSMEAGFIWSFFGPVCIIIAANTFFFLVTVWKLAQKFSSLNPDLNALRKIRTFTITAIAQLCVLGIMWIFGCLQFDSDTRAIAYIFTIFNTLQGVLIFIMHCLLSKQVREEYAKVLARFCSPQKKKYSEFSSNQSKSQVSKSVQHTGESEI
ncbi:CD97 antigen-like [Chanos chanos]|uniref:CD97 antigen-like n=1 Tax=Chanos chanos TaxID=29144 RepID=A0A6J2WMU4_CHACN|nr:CD97 antigen-like [Chanos chanos]